MAVAGRLFLMGCLLQGAWSQVFEVTVPQSIVILRGSCVTIPCSFKVRETFQNALDDTCEAIWKTENNRDVFSSKEDSRQKGELRGILREQDCTTTLNNIDPGDKYYFRLDCTLVKYDFKAKGLVEILVRDEPPGPTVTPSTVTVREGGNLSLTCSAPAPCLSHPPNLTWSHGLGGSQETTVRYRVQSVVNFTASHLHDGEEVSCTATYRRQDGSTEASVTSLMADISYSPKNTTVSVSPSGPVPGNSNVTLTCSSLARPAVRNYTWYRSDGGFETFIGAGRVLNLKASELSGPFFCKAENLLGDGQSNLSKVDVLFAPQILSSSECSKAAEQLNCSCDTVGNPPPALQWYLNGSPVNHSGQIAISSEPPRGAALRSIIAVNQGDLSTLLCCSSNSLGSATQRFYVYSLETQPSAGSRDQVTFAVFITTTVALLVLVCALLCIIRAQKTHHESSCGIRTGATSELLINRDGNESPDTREEDIYVNVSVPRQADVAHPATVSEANSTSLPNRAGDSDSSEKTNEEGSDLIYSTVVSWTRRSKEHESAGSCVEEGGCVVGGMSRNPVSNAAEMESLQEEAEPRNVRREEESEYAHVKVKDKSEMQTQFTTAEASFPLC